MEKRSENSVTAYGRKRLLKKHQDCRNGLTSAQRSAADSFSCWISVTLVVSAVLAIYLLGGGSTLMRWFSW